MVSHNLSCLWASLIPFRSDKLTYCERFIEFLTDLESQLPTRRYINTLLVDLNLLPVLKMSPMFNEDNNGQLRDLYNLLQHFVYFSIDDYTGAEYTHEEFYDAHCKTLARLQKAALKHFKTKLTILALSNYAAIDKRTELEGHLASLTDGELEELCVLLGLRTTYPRSSRVVADRRLLVEVVLITHERRMSFREAVGKMNILPTEVGYPVLIHLKYVATDCRAGHPI
jgi:intron-binding protein aquarius